MPISDEIKQLLFGIQKNIDLKYSEITKLENDKQKLINQIWTSKGMTYKEFSEFYQELKKIQA